VAAAGGGVSAVEGVERAIAPAEADALREIVAAAETFDAAAIARRAMWGAGVVAFGIAWWIAVGIARLAGLPFEIGLRCARRRRATCWRGRSRATRSTPASPATSSHRPIAGPNRTNGARARGTASRRASARRADSLAGDPVAAGHRARRGRVTPCPSRGHDRSHPCRGGVAMEWVKPLLLLVMGSGVIAIAVNGVRVGHLPNGPNGLRQGEGVRRDDNPLGFWFFFALYLALGGYAAVHALRLFAGAPA
jgi:hypothetical protein